ncbi:MAG: hypothetical protein KUG79_13015 [Pseudomonadales bacterium]|nr:hypothetical protein [Pseudomonadales bacterium]
MEIDSILSQFDPSKVKLLLAERITRVASLYAADISPVESHDTIVTFLRHYISFAPELINNLNLLAERLNMTALLSPYVQLASNYLASACHELHQDEEFDSFKAFMTLLHGAYIFLRMIEELDDRIQNFVGIPLSECDTLHANLIAHETIGDDFANRLDRVVTSLFQQSKITKAVIEAQLDKTQLQAFRLAGEAMSGEKIYCLAARHHLSMI